MDLHERGVHQHRPKWRTNNDGNQLVTHGNLSNDGDFHVTVFFYNTGTVLVRGTNFMTWVEEDAKAIKMMVENKQNLVNVTLANASSLLCNSGHPPVTSTPARCTSIVPPAEVHSSVDTTLAKQRSGTSHRQSSQPQSSSISSCSTTSISPQPNQSSTVSVPVTADSPVDCAACSEQVKSIFNLEKQVDNLLHKPG